MKERRTSPPRWMDKIIEWYCSKALLEDLQGDLHEYYARNIKKGRWRADLIFFLDVIKFCRLYTIQKPKILGQMTFFNLIENYFKTSIRSLARNKLFSFINIIGLAVSMSIGLLMITYLSELMTYDEFHVKKDRIYKVTSTYSDLSEDAFDLASTSVFIGEKLRNEYSGYEKVLIMRRNFRTDLEKGENTISVRGHYSSPEFFEVFSFELISGNPTSLLEEPNSIVLTESASKKLFGEVNPVGQIVTSGEKSYTITGLMKDVPPNSHMQFEALASMATLEKRFRGDENTTFFDWDNIWMNHVYLLLDEGKSYQSVNADLSEIMAIENQKTDRFSITHEVENLADITPGRDLSNQIGPNITWKNIYQLIGLTMVIILSACFNYTNLSVARSLRRAKEVGVRKVVGASRAQVFTQFIIEAIIITTVSLVVAFGLYQLIVPGFVNSIIDGENIGMEFRWINLLYFIVFAICIGIISGILPSLVLSKLKAISILTDVTKLRLFKGVNLRRVLIVFQFAISMILIIGTIIMNKQYKFALNYDLGFAAENVLNLELKGNEADLFTAELQKLPEVSMISKSGMIPSTGEIWGEDLKYNDPLDSVSIFVNWVDKNYTEVHKLKFLAGGTFPFDLKDEEDPKYIIFDRNLSERFGFNTPEDAVGEVITILRSRDEDVKVQVSGVIENYRYTDLMSDSEPTALIQSNGENILNLNMVVSTSDAVSLMNKLESIWTKVDKVHPFEASFLDEQVRSFYAHYASVFRIFRFLAFLAISISTMGLLGMAVFTTETRIKEISIRKVLGASEKNLILVLSKSFIYMLLISALIAIPFTYFFFSSFVLEEFTERIPIGFMELAPGALLIIAIGFLTIGWQTLKAAKTNPADMLRDE